MYRRKCHCKTKLNSCYFYIHFILLYSYKTLNLYLKWPQCSVTSSIIYMFYLCKVSRCQLFIVRLAAACSLSIRQPKSRACRKMLLVQAISHPPASQPAGVCVHIAMASIFLCLYSGGGSHTTRISSCYVSYTHTYIQRCLAVNLTCWYTKK